MMRSNPKLMPRQLLVVLGFALIALTPFIGPIPGPGGLIVFGAGLSLILKYTGWAKRLYVRFKRRHPNKGRWTDWSLRRASARRREELRKETAAPAPVDSRDARPGRRRGPKPLPRLAEPHKPIRERKWWE